MPLARDGGSNAERDPGTVDDSSPTSGLSGSTLNNETPPSEHDEMSSLLRTTDEPSLNVHEQHHSISPTLYYDDLRHEDSPDKQQRLTDAAEDEENDSGKENRGLSPTAFFEASGPLPESPSTVAMPSIHSSFSSMRTPFNPSTLSVFPNGGLLRRTKRSWQDVVVPNENPARLHHPFLTGVVDDEIYRAPQGSSSPVSEVSSTRSSADRRTPSKGRAFDLLVKHGKQYPQPDKSLKLYSSSPDSVEIDSPPLHDHSDTRTALRPLKRGRDQSAVGNRDGRLKRLRFDKCVYDLPVSPGLGYEKMKTFSTATTAVNSKPGSPKKSAPIDYDRTVGFAIEGNEEPMTITCHEHLFLEYSGLHDSTCFQSKDNMVTIYPEEKIPRIKPRTVELFVYWLYHGRFTDPGEKECGFHQLLELYYLGHAYAMTVLKNVVIDHLIRRIASHEVPMGRTIRMYSLTPRDDQLRRLWVDVYVWEVSEAKFSIEMESGKLDTVFVQDLALAQMDKIRAMQVILEKEKPLPMTPPYVTAPSAYHVRDPLTNACCTREQYNSEGYFHVNEQLQSMEYQRENARLRNTMERFRIKFERVDGENIDLKRNLRKVQEKVELLICNLREKARDHDYIDHRRLLSSQNWDYPPHGTFKRAESDGTSRRRRLVDMLRI